MRHAVNVKYTLDLKSLLWKKVAYIHTYILYAYIYIFGCEAFGISVSLDGKMGMVLTEKKWRKQNGAGVGEIYNVRLSN